MSRLFLPNIYHIPKLILILVSIGQLCDFGNLVTFSSLGAEFKVLEADWIKL